MSNQTNPEIQISDRVTVVFSEAEDDFVIGTVLQRPTNMFGFRNPWVIDTKMCTYTFDTSTPKYIQKYKETNS